MADPVMRFKRDTQTLVERVQEGWQAALGIDLPMAGRLAGNPGAAALVTNTPPEAFATGYDGTETTMTFTFDFSHFDADPLG